MQKFVLDLKFALRQLRKSPGFTITAVLMLAFGIGATTAIFSIVEGVLLRPLPFPDSGRLTVLADHLAGVDIPGGGDEAGVTVRDIVAYTRDTHSFTALGGYTGSGYELSGSGEPAQVNASRLTAGVFSALGVAPAMGRVFTAYEDEHQEKLTVLSYATWKTRFHADPQVVGSKILLDRKPYTIIGVMPRNFEFPLIPGQLNRSELWVPMSFTVDELSPERASNWSYQMIGRLKPGISPAQAESDANRVAKEIMAGYPADMANLHINSLVRPLQNDTVKQSRSLLRTLFLAVAVVLLIACFNLAGLMLVRAIRRQREVAVRLALGAQTGALIRQAILESLVLSVSGGVLGLILAGIALRVGKSLLPETLPRVNEISLSWQVVAFALALAVVTGIVCALAPAFAAIRTNVNSNLKEGGRTGSAGGGHARLRSTLVVAEIAIALVLLAASGLLLRSFDKMRGVDLGFTPQNVTTASYSLPQQQYPKQPQIDAFNRELMLKLNQLPGVESAGITTMLPSQGANNNQTFVVDGYVPPAGAGMNLATVSQVMGNFFPALGIRLLRGRFFADSDHTGTQLVVIVNHKFARHFWPDNDPIGKRIRIGTQQMQTPWLTVVGEVSDTQLLSPDNPATEQYYVPVSQAEEGIGALAQPGDLNGNGGSIVLRSALPAEQMENALRTTVRSIDPLLPVTQVETMQQVVSDSEAERRFNTVLISSFAFAAVLLAILGIYSVIAFSVASRVQEMAIRMTLGSQRTAIVRLVLESGAKLAAIGCVIGLAGAAAASGLLRSMLFGVSPFDPLVLIVAAVCVLILAVAASTLPAFRAASIDPMQALRGE
jgi:putative ABC transport system permease protein